MNYDMLKDAAEKIKRGEKEKALEVYRKIKENTDPSRKAFCCSLDFMIDSIKDNSQSYADDPLLHVKDGIDGTKRNNVIVLINPSHAHELEREFWQSYIANAKNRGFEVVELAFRSVTPFSSNPTIVSPARAVDLARKYDNFNNYDRPRWFDNDLLNHYSDWEHRRWQLGKYHSKVKIGIENTAKFIDEVIRSLNPTMIITTNKIDWPNNFGFLAAKHYAINYYFIERSPLDSHIIEDVGMFSESRRTERLIFDQNIIVNKAVGESSNSLINRLAANPYGFRAEEAVKNTLPELMSDKKIFFLPLDNIIWTGWGMNFGVQGEIDYPLYKTPSQALARLATEIGELGGQLVVKPHPSCREWPRLAPDLPEVVFCDSDLQELVNIADVVVTFLTKVSYVALAFDKPVVSFGGGLVDNLGITYQVDSDSMLSSQLEKAVNKISLKSKLTKFRQLLPSLNDTFFESGGDAFNFMYKNAEQTTVSNLPNIDQVLNNVQRVIGRKARADVTSAFPGFEEFKPTVLFDVSRLTSGAMWNSGISRYARALVRGLKKSRLFNVVCGANFANNDFGLSSFYLSKLESELNITVVDIKEAFIRLDKLGRNYIYHSPVNPEQMDVPHNNAVKVITIHDILHVTQSDFYDAVNTITPRIINAVDHDTTAVVFDSEFSKSDFENYTGTVVKNSAVVHLGVDEAFLNLIETGISSAIKKVCSMDKKKLVIPFQGDPRKGFSRMLSIAKRWQREFSDNRCVIVFGSSKNRYRYKEVLEQQNWSDSDNNDVYYIENSTDEELAYIYKSCIANMYLSEAEGFGLPPLESMSCGCPSITLSNTSLTEVYQGWQLQLENDSSDSTILKILNKLTVDDIFSSELRYKAIKFANNYQWSKTVEETMSFYIKLLKI